MYSFEHAHIYHTTRALTIIQWRIRELMATSKQLKNFTQQAINVFRDCSLIPILSRARIVPRKGGYYEVEATWSQRDLERGKNVAFTESYFVRRTSGNIIEEICNSTFPANATQM